jgi:penicillin-insensitive murein endopeptidase
MITFAGLALALWTPVGARADAVAEKWGQIAKPAIGDAKSIGGAAAGCLQGAAALPADGDGYQVLRLKRNRFYGHPRTIRFVQQLAAAAHAEGIDGILVGDLAQPRGGPMPSGHGSHQNGLDVDIWFRLAPQGLNPDEREAPDPVSMVRNNHINPAAWKPAQARLLELAARRPEVDRIFVNPAIKSHLCHTLRPEQRDWLHTLRPWWGHNEHFHVRLACTEGDPTCEPQRPVPDGDGCGVEVDSWLAQNTILPDKPVHRTSPTLPAACAGLLVR